MDEYIEREKALNDFDEWIDTTGALPKGTSYYYECRACIEDVPSADVVEVVRCRDCKYYKNGKHFTDIKFCQRLPYYAEKGGLNTADNDYCSYGERKEGE